MTRLENMWLAACGLAESPLLQFLAAIAGIVVVGQLFINRVTKEKR